MTDTRRARLLTRLARQDHERNCRNEPEWPHLSVSHHRVHEVNAMRQARRMASVPVEEGAE